MSETAQLFTEEDYVTLLKFAVSKVGCDGLAREFGSAKRGLQEALLTIEVLKNACELMPREFDGNLKQAQKNAEHCKSMLSLLTVIYSFLPDAPATAPEVK